MSPPKEDLQVHTPTAEATEWFVSLQAADLSFEEQNAFADWLRRSPLHVEEFLQCTALHGDLARLPELLQLDVAALLAEVDGSGNVVEFPPRVSPTGEAQVVREGPNRATRPVFRLSLALSAAIVLIAVGLAAAGVFSGLLDMERYRTSIGEQRSVVLADGSRVQLNVSSALSAKVSQVAREIRLNDGEALFDVAKDSVRPFRVHTPEATIEAIGTRFNVYVRNGETVVALLDGRVAVRSSRDAAPVVLDPGQQVTMAAYATGRATVRAADLDTVMAWREHRLVFEDATLAEVVAEFNRYSRQQLAIEDVALSRLRVTASFDSSSVQAFTESLAAAGGLRVARRSGRVWVIER